MNDTPIEYLSTRKAAAFLGLSPRTLDPCRVTGQGPVFHKFGTRIRYTRGDLDAWAAARRMTSTSDLQKITALVAGDLDQARACLADAQALYHRGIVNVSTKLSLGWDMSVEGNNAMFSDRLCFVELVGDLLGERE